MYPKRLERQKAYDENRKQQDPDWWERRKKRVREKYKGNREDPAWQQKRRECRKRLYKQDPEKFRAQRREQYYKKRKKEQENEPKTVSGAKEAVHEAKSASSTSEQDSSEAIEIVSETKQAKLSKSQNWRNRLKEQDPKAWEALKARRRANRQRRKAEKHHSYMKELDLMKKYYQQARENHPEKYEKILMSRKRSYRRKRKAETEQLLAKSQRVVAQKTETSPSFHELELQRHSKEHRGDREEAETLKTTQKMKVDHPRKSSPKVQLDATQQMEGNIQRESSPKALNEPGQSTAAKHQAVDLAALLQGSNIDDALTQIGFPPSP